MSTAGPSSCPSISMLGPTCLSRGGQRQAFLGTSTCCSYCTAKSEGRHPGEMFGKWQGRPRGERRLQHTTEGCRVEASARRSGMLRISPPALTGLHLFWDHQQKFTVLPSQVMPQKLPGGRGADKWESDMLGDCKFQFWGPGPLASALCLWQPWGTPVTIAWLPPSPA